MNQDKKIKSIETSKFIVTLFEGENDRYYVLSETKYNGAISYTVGIRDYGLASSLFDIKVAEADKKH